MEADPVIRTVDRKPMRLSPWLQSLLAFTVVVVLGVLFPWASEKPPRKFFYPFIALVAIANAIQIYRDPFPAVLLADRPIELRPTAMLRALRWGLLLGVTFFLLYYLGWDSPGQAWGQAFIIAVLATNHRYTTGRKLEHPVRAQIVAGSIALVSFAIIKLLLRHH